MADVIDGTSNTITFGERESSIGRGATWLGVFNASLQTGTGVSLVVGHAQPKPNEVENLAIQPPYTWNYDRLAPMGGYTSLHPNGLQFAFCDGSVRWINNQINHSWSSACGSGSPGGPNPGSIADEKRTGNGVYQRLMSRSDKLPLIGDY